MALSREQKQYKAISKELGALIKQKHEYCNTESQKNQAVNDARQEINSKYGHEWRNLKYQGPMVITKSVRKVSHSEYWKP